MTLTYPDNSIARYSWDEINGLTSVSDGSNNLIAGYQYDKANRLKRLDYENGLYERYEYDALGQLLETYELFNEQESLLYKYAFIVRETDRATGKALSSFDYDATNRMVKATNAQGETSE